MKNKVITTLDATPYEAILRPLKDMVYITDVSQVVVFVNDSFKAFFGVEDSEIIGFKLEDISRDQADFKLLSKEDGKALGKEQEHENFYDFRGKPSCTFDQIKTSKTLIRNDEGRVIGLTGIITCIDQEFTNNDLLARGVKHYQNIQQLTIAISKLTSETEIHWTLVEECARLLKLEDCVIYIYDDQQEILAQRAVFGMKKSEGKILSPVILELGEGLVGAAAKMRETILIDDLSREERYVEDVFSARSEISVPIVFQDKIIGVIDSESPRKDFFNIKHKDFLETIASIAALKIAELRNLKTARQNGQHLHQILESPKNLMAYSIDTDLRYKTFNKKHAAMIKEYFGFDIEEGLDVLSVIANAKEREEYHAIYKKVLKGEDHKEFEDYDPHSKGEVRHLEKFYSPLLSIDKQVIGVNAFIRDITEARKSALRLEEREHLLNSINENIRDGIFRFSVERGFLYSNRALQEMFRTQDVETKFVDFESIHFAKNDYLDISKEVIENGSIEQKEVNFKRFDGTTFWGLLDCQLTIQDGQKVVDGVITDITFQKELSQDLMKTNSEMDQLVYRASHDLRAPIVSLLGLANLVTSTSLDENQKELMGIMTTQLHVLDRIIIDIINYRKVAKLGLHKEKIDLKSVAQDIIDGVQFMEHLEQVQSVIEMDGSWDFVNDPHNIQIILNNLIINAIKYSKKNDPNSLVKIEIKVNEKQAFIAVEDNGIGIEDGFHEKVFDMFYRATNHNTGTGLGLFIVKEAVGKLKGKISFTSAKNEGSRFELIIPNEVSSVDAIIE